MYFYICYFYRILLNRLFLLALSISLIAIFSLGLVEATTKDKDDKKDDDEDNSRENEHDESEDGDNNGESETIDSSTFFGNSNEVINTDEEINANVESSDIIIKSVLKSGKFFKSNLYVPEDNTKFTFSNGNELYPTNDCESKFLEGELNIDKEDTLFNPEFKYQIQGKYFPLTNEFEVIGKIDN